MLWYNSIMSTAVAPILHIRTDDRGIAFVDGTGIKVKQLVSFHQAWGWSPEEIQRNFPHLSLGQIYAALAYYHDHREQIDAEIEDDQSDAERIANQFPISDALRHRLRQARDAK